MAGPVPAGATCIGNCGTSGADGDVSLSPLNNTAYLYVTTAGGTDGAGQISSVGGTNGSSLQTGTFTANVGDALNFYFNFITSDGAGFSDYAFAELLNANNGVAATLFTARTQPTGNTSPGFGLPANQSALNPGTSGIIAGATNWSPLAGDSGACFDAGCGSTGWIQANYVIPTAGTYSLLFGTTNVGDSSYNTGLAIDGVTVANQSIISADAATDVPEPASLVLLATAAGGVALRRRPISRTAASIG